MLASADWNGVVKVWDSTLLTPEVRQQRADQLAELRLEREAAAMVRSVAEKQPLKEDVLATLRGDQKLKGALRDRVLVRAEGYRENPGPLNEAAWQLAVKPGAKAEEYERAVRYAEAACRVDPGNGVQLNTLGAAQYRAGKFEAAIATLRESAPLNAERFGGPIPADWAFLAMAYHRLGKTKEVGEAMETLRKAMKNKRWMNDPESQALQREAEQLVNPGQ